MLAILATAGLLGGCSTESDRGAADERSAANSYVTALNNRDTPALHKLAPPGNSADEDIKDRLARHGGRGISVESVDLRKDFGEDHASAHVLGKDSQQQRFEERLTLTRVDGRWYVALGSNPGSGKPSSSTR
ncbi:hypothetical protein JOF53_000339 [Crossiella equi]|uniref:Lipoprotein n=1 Tax=Crossiella equi TaxID=130796 RepID=A0ABS5A5D9_9PSEU|nr:hypothetical protein [Crossiella equi]MBP2471467.1 hypothetical protein [Crossiella equi]